MTILVVSDSHGNVQNMIRAAERTAPARILYLGDGWRDADRLAERFPAIPIDRVPGNCDYRRGEPKERLLTVEGRRILMCHGHTYFVKTDLRALLDAALRQRADIALFGHTHRPLVDYRSGVFLMNPGSIGASARPSYGTIEIADGALNPSIYLI